MNPYKYLRQSLDLTQRELAQEAGVTDQVVLRCEQGLFTVPPRSITAALLRRGAQIPTRDEKTIPGAPHLTDPAIAHQEPSERLESAWYLWVLDTRFNNRNSDEVTTLQDYLSHKPHIKEPPYNNLTYITKHVLQLSTASLAKLLVIQISLLQDFFKTGHNMAMVESILSNWGIPTQLIDFTPLNSNQDTNLQDMHEAS